MVGWPSMGCWGFFHAGADRHPAIWPTRWCCCDILSTPEKVKKAISVVKKRSGKRNEESIRELRFDAQGIHLSEPLTQFRGNSRRGVPVETQTRAERDAVDDRGRTDERPK